MGSDCALGLLAVGRRDGGSVAATLNTPRLLISETHEFGSSDDAPLVCFHNYSLQD